jgi:hypothetical protein
MLTLLLFMYIFSFPLLGTSSGYIVGMILSIIFLVNSKYREIFYSWLLNRKVLKILLSLLSITAVSLLISTFRLTYEYSIVKVLFSQTVFLIIGIMLFSLYQLKNKNSEIIKHIILIFILQSSIQLISFISPTINEGLNIFRGASTVQIQGNYTGVRGLAVSGPAFFGLAICYALIYIYLIIYRGIFNKYSIFVKLLVCCLLLFGGLSAGRTSFVGILFGLGYVVILKLFKTKYMLKNTISIKPINLIFLSSILMIFFVVYLQGIDVNEQVILKVNAMSDYLLQFYHSYKDTGEFTTTSTSTLFNEMYFKVKYSTLIFGDALYSNTDGSYYMHTDAGYMRNILYFGIIGLFFLILYQFLLFHWNESKLRLQNLIIFIFILTIHIKGDVLAYSVAFQSIIFVKYLYDYKTLKEV